MPEQRSDTAVLDRSQIQAWEYEVVSIHARHNQPLEEGLNERGREGWELVFVTMPMSNDYQCIFRRPAR